MPVGSREAECQLSTTVLRVSNRLWVRRLPLDRLRCQQPPHHGGVAGDPSSDHRERSLDMTDTPTDRAAQLGAEHGKAAAEAWCHGAHWVIVDTDDSVLDRFQTETGALALLATADYPEGAAVSFVPEPLPEPDLSDYTEDDLYEDCGFNPEYGNDGSVLGAYESAFRAAVETTVRERCEEVTR